MMIASTPSIGSNPPYLLEQANVPQDQVQGGVPNLGNYGTVHGAPLPRYQLQPGIPQPPVPGAATVPGTPLMRMAEVGPAGNVNVTFWAPASDGGSPILGYQVVDDTNGVARLSPGSPAMVPKTMLRPGVRYSFAVRARNALGYGNASSVSNVVTL